jgi:inorganic pyrophosphatase
MHNKPPTPVFIEITPFDLMKYEVDKVSGYLHVDRPQRFSAHPALYGFIPRTYCAERVRKLAPGARRGEADDKIVTVLENDNMWGTATDVSEVPPVLIERLQHYFLTYKLVPGQRPVAQIGRTYGRRHALRVVKAAMADYAEAFMGAR